MTEFNIITKQQILDTFDTNERYDRRYKSPYELLEIDAIASLFTRVEEIETGIVTVTASAQGTVIPDLGKDTRVLVTSTNPDHIVILPPPSVMRIILLVEATAVGYELRSSDPANIAINGGTGVNAESAIPASNAIIMLCHSLAAWSGTRRLTNGTVGQVEQAAP